MYDAPGVGLAATQVGVAKRVAVMDCSEDKNDPIVMINPEILSIDDEYSVEEGCLSVPGHFDKITRFGKTHLRATDRHGEQYELEADGLLAQCIQHEIDHLAGNLFIDYLSPLKRQMALKKVKKHLKSRS